EFGGENLVGRAEPEPGGGVSPASQRGVGHRVADQIKGFGGIGGPDQFVGLGTDELRHGFTALFEDLGSLDSKGVRTAVNRGVGVYVVVLLGFVDTPRFLAGGARVEVHHIGAVDLVLKDL